MASEARVSPTGKIVGFGGTLAIASFVIATTAGATVTGSFTGARVNDVVNSSPQANLTGSAVSVAFSRVVSNDIIVLGFTNPGASTNQAAVTFDVWLDRRLTTGAAVGA